MDPSTAFDNLQPTTLYQQFLDVVTKEVQISPGGQISVSIATVVAAIVVLLLTFWVSKLAQRFLRKRILSRVELDSGLSYTLQRLVHYIVLVFGVLVALRIGFGVDYTSLAVVATALSVGIGLGLKEIASDVAAGFILLFERPVRVGDVLKLSGDLGIVGSVTAIDLRTTKIRTPDGFTAIIPNSKLTNEKYVNLSFGGAPLRLFVTVGVAYGTDLAKAKQLLAEAATSLDGVLAEPAPIVRMVGFGDSSIDFEVQAFTHDFSARLDMQSDLHLRIEESLRQKGIEIPFPQRDFHVRSVPDGFVPAAR